jgi:hypothetical protein
VAMLPFTVLADSDRVDCSFSGAAHLHKCQIPNNGQSSTVDARGTVHIHTLAKRDQYRQLADLRAQARRHNPYQCTADTQLLLSQRCAILSRLRRVSMPCSEA